MTNKKIIIISYFFAPANMMGAIRMTKISKYLFKKGYDISVITSDNSTLLFQKEKCDVDPFLQNDIEGMDVRRVKHGFLYSFVSKILRKFSTGRPSYVQTKTTKKRTFKRKLLHYILFYMSLWQDKDFARRGKKVFKSLSSQEGNIIISSYGPVASHLLAAKVKGKKDVLICDFRDPIAQNTNYKHEFKVNKRLEKTFINRSDYVVAVSKGYLASLGLEEDNNHLVITNGFDLSDYNEVVSKENRREKIVISYVGTLYSGKRDLTPLFKALNELRSLEGLDISRFELHYAGPQGDYFNDVCSKSGLSDISKNFGQITRDESVKLQAESDCILVLTWNDYDGQGVLPGKFFEAMMFDKPLLVLVSGTSKNSEIKKLLPENAGFCFEEANENDLNHLKDFLRSLYFNEGHFSMDGFHKYNYKNIATKYEMIIENAWRGRLDDKSISNK